MRNFNINRRDFLAFSLLAAGSLLIKINVPFRKNWIDAARNEIPAVKHSLYFQTGGIGPSPQCVIDEIKAKLEFQNQGPADPRFSSSMSQIEPDLREHIAKCFNADTEEIALTHSTTEGINIAIWSVNWKEGDEVILSNQEHPANIIPWYNLRDRFGIKFRLADLSTGTNLIAAVKKQITPKTKMVSISHVSRENGRALLTGHSAELGEILRKRGIRYHLDGAQGPGCIPTDLHALNCDYYSMCGHKWLLGPKGTAALYVRKSILNKTLPSWIGSHSHSTMDYEGNFTWKPDASRFEFGTRALADFAGFNRALMWLQKIGYKKIYDRIDYLIRYALEKVNKNNTFQVVSPESEGERSGILVLRLPRGIKAGEIYDKLAKNDHILTSPLKREQDIRVCLHFFNTEEEFDILMEKLEEYC